MPATAPHAVCLALAALDLAALGLAVLGMCALPLVVAFRPAWLVRGLLAPLLPSVLFSGPAQRRELVLTIDDGPSPATATSPGSGALLALLRQLELPATLFVISGHLAQGPPGFLRQALADGHTIGNHMPSDQVSARLAMAEFRRQLASAEASLRQAAEPLELPHPLGWFRPGGGWFHPAMLRTLKREGYRLVLGSVFPWDTLHPPLTWLEGFVLANVHPGAILVLHDRPDTLPTTLALLARVVPELRRRGYRFTNLAALTRPIGQPPDELTPTAKGDRKETPGQAP
jgi:peptidoglycan/xylan/chitin deacetylase (PgdA/CDA1 family)